MIKIRILKNNIETNAAQFLTQLEADNWLNDCIQKNYFGKPERWVLETQEDISNALDIRNVIDIVGVPAQYDVENNLIQEEILEVSHNEYLLPAEYDVEQLDITEEIAKQAMLEQGRARQDLGSRIIAKVYAINESKNISPETFTAMMADSNLERIERMLWTGSLRTAKLMISALDNTYFTADEKQIILDMLVDY